MPEVRVRHDPKSDAPAMGKTTFKDVEEAVQQAEHQQVSLQATLLAAQPTDWWTYSTIGLGVIGLTGLIVGGFILRAQRHG